MLTFIEKLKLCRAILTEKDNAFIRHARTELDALMERTREKSDPRADEMQALMHRNLLELVTVFSTQRHSGFSASYARGMLDKLLKFEPIGPLTGEDHEWAESSLNDGLLQNKRCSRVFKDLNTGEAFDIEGYIFEDENGARYTSRESEKTVTFPYVPESETVYRVDEPECADETGC